MHHRPLSDRLLLGPAILLVLMADAFTWLWHAGYGGLVWLGQRGKLPRLQNRIARLSPAPALLLFLIPEACSRLGWMASAWLLLQGRPSSALLIYGATKLTAGLAALWIFHACEPALMQVRWFAALRRSSTTCGAAMRARVMPSASRSPILIRARQALRRPCPHHDSPKRW